jgi:UDP-3-O-[3-hydroxymyristoyl] glucosamine N-acyltransferase
LLPCEKSVTEIASIIDGQVEGDQEIWITGLSGIEEAQEGDLTFLANAKYASLVQKTKASAIIVDGNTDCSYSTIIRTKDASYSFGQIASLFLAEDYSCHKGVHPTAYIGRNVTLGEDVNIGPHAILEDGVSVGDRSTITGGVYLGPKVQVGQDCLFYANVSIREGVQVGNRVILHPGVVLGADGFGYVYKEGRHQKIPQLGIVVLEDDVEVGANSCIDRARFQKTIIGQGTKIDNLVQIAHNIQIGKNCLIVAQVGMSGSTIVEDNVILAGQSGVNGHLRIREGTILMGKSVVTKSWPARSKVMGDTGPAV